MHDVRSFPYLLCGVLVLIAVFAGRSAVAEPLRIVASLPPLGLIANDIAGAEAQVETLHFAGSDVHHASLRPSDLRLLQRADIVVRVDPGMEVGLQRVIARLPPSTSVITLSESVSRHSAGADPADSRQATQHLWLDPRAGLAAAAEIAAAITARRPARSLQVTQALRRLESELAAFEARTVQRLAAYRQRGILVTHDAYGPFVQRFGLRQLGALRDRHDAMPGARSTARFRELARSQQAYCLLADSRLALQQVQSLLSDASINSAVIPPLGSGDEDSYLQLLQAVANGLDGCLADPER